MTDSEELKYASIYVKEWIDRQPNVKEETLTDWLLMQVSYKINRIYYQSFSRHQESRTTGADWEWWFLYPHIVYRFRVQAKKMYLNNATSLKYKWKKATQRQINRLLQDARNTNSIPLYAFYANNITVTACFQGITNEGVYLSSANELFQNFIRPDTKKITKDDISRLSIPLSCMLCCELIQKTGFDAFVDKYFKLTPSLYSNYPNLGKYDYGNIPPYLTTILKFREGQLPDWFDEEYKNKLEGVNAIMVVDNRQ